MIATTLALLVGLLIGLTRAAVYEMRDGRRHRQRELDLSCELLGKGAQVAYLKEQAEALGAILNHANETIARKDARINQMLDTLHEKEILIIEQARTIARAQRQTRNLPTSDFIFPN